MHRRVAGGEAVGVGVAFDVGQPQRLRLADQLAEDAAPARQVADVPPALLVDADVDETFELAAFGVEHAERRVPRPGQLPRRLDH